MIFKIFNLLNFWLNDKYLNLSINWFVCRKQETKKGNKDCVSRVTGDLDYLVTFFIPSH